MCALFAALALCIFKEGGPAGLHPSSLRGVREKEKGGGVTLPLLSLLLECRLKRPANQRGGWWEGGIVRRKSRGERGEDVPPGEKGGDGW